MPNSPAPLLPPAPAALLVALIHSADGVEVAAVATALDQLDRLWPEDAAQVYALLEAGKISAAVEAYFLAAGRRWDRERLTVARLELPQREAIAHG